MAKPPLLKPFTPTFVPSTGRFAPPAPDVEEPEKPLEVEEVQQTAPPEPKPKPASVTNSHAGCNYRVCPHPSALELLIDAAIEVESGGDNKAVGDDGKAIGSLQIWRIYFDEAVRVDKKGILRDYRYADCYDRNVAIAVFMIHMRHHAPTELEILKHHVGPWDDTVMTCAEHIYRIHNGGPDGWKQNSTLKNWWKVKALLE